MNIHLKRIVGNLFDVFFGDEWGDWTRIALKNGVIEYVKGTRRSSEVMNKLQELAVAAKGKK